MNEGKSCERRQRLHHNMTGSAVIGSCSKSFLLCLRIHKSV